MRDDGKQAETLALQALAWLAADDDLFPAFMSATGADAAQMKDSAQSPGFLGAVLDFLLSDDAWVVAFCRDHGLPYDALSAARARLPGGDVPHWT